MVHIPFRICENGDKNNCTGNVGKDVAEAKGGIGSYSTKHRLCYPTNTQLRRRQSFRILLLLVSDGLGRRSGQCQTLEVSRPGSTVFSANALLASHSGPRLRLRLPGPFCFAGYSDTARLDNLKSSSVSEPACPT